MLKKEDIYNIVPKNVIFKIFDGFSLDLEDGVHGFDHWSRVIDNGMILSEQNGANKGILIAFGLFHDVERENDHEDPQHGYRGGQLLLKYKDKINLSEEEINKVIEACSGHTDQLHHNDLDIGTCWDSDRLDLYRVGIYPEKEYLNNDYSSLGRELIIEEASERAEIGYVSDWSSELFADFIKEKKKLKKRSSLRI